MPPSPIDPTLPRYPTVVHALVEAARRAPGRTALIFEGRELTYAQYLRAVAGFARRLGRHGVAGGRVAVMTANSIEAAVAMLGVMAARAQMVPFNPFFTVSELRPQLADSQPSVLVCDAGSADKARALAGDLPVEVLTPDDIARWRDDATATLPEPLPADDDWATLPYTGGTTGLPKGANHRHANITTFFTQVLTQWPLGFDDQRFLNVAPMFHIWGSQFATWIPIYTRNTLVVLPKYEPDRVLDAIERHRITVFAGGPPAIYIGLTSSPRFATTDFSSLRYCLSGGAPCPEQLLRGWEQKTGCVLLEGYGMSEGAPIANNPINGARKLLSVGLASPETEVEVVDVETGTRAMPTGERGEVRVRGRQFMQGYRNRPEETAQTLRDGWLHTGDIGFLDEDGYLFLVDRKKDMVIVGGYNVYPRAVEEVLFKHPAIHEAAVVGAPDDRLGEVLMAFVALRPDATLGEEEFFAYCAENLVKYRRPVRVTFMPMLPKTAANKIDKLALRARARAAST